MVVRRRMAGLDAAALVDGHVHHHAALVHLADQLLAAGSDA